MMTRGTGFARAVPFPSTGQYRFEPHEMVTMSSLLKERPFLSFAFFEVSRTI